MQSSSECDFIHSNIQQGIFLNEYSSKCGIHLSVWLKNRAALDTQKEMRSDQGINIMKWDQAGKGDGVLRRGNILR